MKKIICHTLFILTLSFSSCKQLASLVNFDMHYDNNVTIPANSIINVPIDLGLPVTTNSEQQFESQGTASNLITKIVLDKLELTIVNPSNADFDFLKSVEVYVSADGLQEVRVAYNMDVPTGLQIVPLTCVDTDLKEYVKKNTFDIRLNTVTDEVLTNDTEVKIGSTFKVSAGLS